MKHCDRRTALGLFAAAASAALTTRLGLSQDRGAARGLDTFIRMKMDQARAPGLSAAVVRGGRVVWTGCYGFADVERRAPVTPSTLFLTASVSKPVTAAALLTLVESGRLGLDDDVSSHLPFPVRHPRFPRAPITPRALLTHTAGLDDSSVPDDLVVSGDSPIPLATLVSGYFSPGGPWYDADENFTRHAPNAGYNYSNMGMTLAGYLAERVSRESFESLCRRAVLAPLGMTTSGWRLAHVDRGNVAVPYASRRGRYVPRAQYGFPDIPDGALRTTATEYARFVLAMLGGGALDGARVLRPATVAEMLRVQRPALAPEQSLAWYHPDEAPTGALGHHGAYLGASADVVFVPSQGVGVVVLTNGESYYADRSHEERALESITARLLQESSAL